MPVVSTQFFLKLINPDNSEYDSTFNVILSKERLLNWSGWGYELKEYINEFDIVEIKYLFENYQIIINNVCEKLSICVEEYYKDQILEYYKIDDEIEEITLEMEELHNKRGDKNPDFNIIF